MFSEEIQAELKRNILESFPKIDPPSFEDLTSHRCPECDAVRDDFNGIKWWEAEYSLIDSNFA